MIPYLQTLQFACIKKCIEKLYLIFMSFSVHSKYSSFNATSRDKQVVILQFTYEYMGHLGSMI